MKAIFTKYHGPTDFKGSRISASDHDGNALFVPYDHASSEPHRDAAVALCRKMGWHGTLIEGADSSTGGSVYVWLADSAVVNIQPEGAVNETHA